MPARRTTFSKFLGEPGTKSQEITFATSVAFLVGRCKGTIIFFLLMVNILVYFVFYYIFAEHTKNEISSVGLHCGPEQKTNRDKGQVFNGCPTKFTTGLIVQLFSRTGSFWRTLGMFSSDEPHLECQRSSSRAERPRRSHERLSSPTLSSNIHDARWRRDRRTEGNVVEPGTAGAKRRVGGPQRQRQTGRAARARGPRQRSSSVPKVARKSL